MIARPFYVAAAVVVYRARLPLAVFAVEFGVALGEWMERRRAR